MQDITQELGQRYRIDFGILEGVIVFLLVLLYQPIRQRVAEALRYLMGRSSLNIRQRTRDMAVAMWQHMDDEPQALVDWFVREIQPTLEVDWAAALLFDAEGNAFIHSRIATEADESQLATLHGVIESRDCISCSYRSASRGHLANDRWVAGHTRRS